MTLRWWLAGSLLALASCSSDTSSSSTEASSTGQGTGGGATTVGTTTGETSAATGGPSAGGGAAEGGGSATGTGGGAASGGGGAGDGGAGDGGGAPAPAPEVCFELHDEASCLAAGCDDFILHPDVLVIVDGVCRVDEGEGLCLVGGDSGAPAQTTKVRVFEGDGPWVVRFGSDLDHEGWVACTRESAIDHPECCCPGAVPFDPEGVCDGITPVAD